MTEIGLPEQALTGEHLRAARRLLGWSADALAARSRTNPSVIKRLETFEGSLPRKPGIEAIRSALEEAGVEFFLRDSGRAAVRMRKAAAG